MDPVVISLSVQAGRLTKACILMISTYNRSGVVEPMTDEGEAGPFVCWRVTMRPAFVRSVLLRMCRTAS